MDSNQTDYPAMDTATAMSNVRQALATIVALQPFDGTAESWSYQHVAGGTMRCVRQSFDGLTIVDTVVTPLDTLTAVKDHLRALMVEVLR